MAWAEVWPLTFDMAAPKLLSHANELAKELNRRMVAIGEGAPFGVDAPFAVGDNARGVLSQLRVAVSNALPNFYNPNTATAWLTVPNDDAEADHEKSRNIFFHKFESLPVMAPPRRRTTWRNRKDGTEATAAQSYIYPEECVLEDSDLYPFLFNELHDIIDALEWKLLAGTNTYDLMKTADALDLATAQIALDTAWGDMLADTPVAATRYEALCWYSQFGGLFTVGQMGQTRKFTKVALPATAVGLRLLLENNIAEDYYDKDVGGVNTRVVNPDWNWLVYSGTGVPDTTDWDYGALVATVSRNDNAARTVNIATFTAGVDNYLQTGAEEVKPQHIVDDGWWGGGFAYYGKALWLPQYVLYKI